MAGPGRTRWLISARHVDDKMISCVPPLAWKEYLCYTKIILVTEQTISSLCDLVFAFCDNHQY